VPLEDLRLLKLSHWGFDGKPKLGQLIVHKDLAKPMIAAFKAVFEQRFPIEQMRLVDDFGGNDDASMTANNTSAFNCRTTPGSTRFSLHAYGRAVDINPAQNPYIKGTTVLPPEAEPFRNRQSKSPGLIRDGEGVVRAFKAAGFEWGGDWTTLKDYQHFERKPLEKNPPEKP